MKSKEAAESIEINNVCVDAIEDNEKYDEFNVSVTMPANATSLGKSPLSDEGIETDNTERRGSFVARSWSLESANHGDEDSARMDKQWEKRKCKQKVTRCCSSDSAVLSDEEPVKGWENMIICDGAECDESTEGRPRYWRTPSVVVSDYSDYSYLDEKYERSDPDLEKYENIASETASQTSSCSCLDCDDIREFQDLTNSLDNRLLRVRGSRRHSDSSCACLTANLPPTNSITNDPPSRRNSCLASPNTYRYKQENGTEFTNGEEPRTKRTSTSSERKDSTKKTIELLDIPPFRKNSDCSTNSSLSGDDFEVTELRPFARKQSTLRVNTLLRQSFVLRMSLDHVSSR